MDLGLQLMEGCVAAGMNSVAKYVSRMLLSQVWIRVWIQVWLRSGSGVLRGAEGKGCESAMIMP